MNILAGSGPCTKKSKLHVDMGAEKKIQNCDILHLFDTTYAFLIFMYHILIPNVSTLMNTSLTLSFNFLDILMLKQRQTEERKPAFNSDLI